MSSEVNFKSFQVAHSEVTVEQYKICVEAGVCEPPIRGVGCNYHIPGHHKHPMNCVSWFQARRFSQWVGGDLPSEGQWEFMASQQFSSTYPWGTDTPSCDRVLMFGNESSGCDQMRTNPVCSKEKGNSKEGICDLVGSVWEWVLDIHTQREPGSISAQPSCDSQKCDKNIVAKRVSKGGSWVNGSISQSAKVRDYTNPAYMFNFKGFRPIKVNEVNPL
jgi:formylglycine-generating enzyme